MCGWNMRGFQSRYRRSKFRINVSASGRMGIRKISEIIWYTEATKSGCVCHTFGHLIQNDLVQCLMSQVVLTYLWDFEMWCNILRNDGIQIDWVERGSNCRIHEVVRTDRKKKTFQSRPRHIQFDHSVAEIPPKDRIVFAQDLNSVEGVVR